MDTYEKFLNAPCKVINLKKNEKRMATTEKRLKDAGFKNIERFDAYGLERLKEGWGKLNNPNFASDKKDYYFQWVLGKQGCFLSHVLLWKEIIEQNIPFVTIFEDDILFHHKWDMLSRLYFERTPIDYDVLYIGSQFMDKSTFHIDRIPVLCLHAYIITLEGAKKLYDLVINTPIGMHTIDGMTLDLMYSNSFNWYIWNGTFYPPLRKMKPDWDVRNNGLVYQDEDFGSDIINFI